LNTSAGSIRRRESGGWLKLGVIAALALGLSTLAGCQSTGKAFTPLSQRTEPVVLTGLCSIPVNSVEAQCAPPDGWIADPLKKDSVHTHLTWISPTKRTAYGVVHFNLPLPVGPDLVLWGFMRHMSQHEGGATLLNKRYDPDLPGLRFEAIGGPYTIRVNLIARGFEGWAVYAGTLTNQPVDQKELQLAERARENTTVGLPMEVSAK
jgi:hypothetical protein